MIDPDYLIRMELGVREVCDLAQHMSPEEAEEFFRSIAHQAISRFRRLHKENTNG